MTFYEYVAPYAERAAEVLSIPAEVIMAQWAVESAHGGSSLARRAFNLGGIKYNKYSIAEGKTGAFAKYKDLDQFTDDYIRVMSLPYYKEVRDAEGIEDTVQALAASPYDAGHYGGTGQSILDIIKIKQEAGTLPDYSLSNPRFDYKGEDADKETIIDNVFGESPEDWSKKNPAVIPDLIARVGDGLQIFAKTWIIIILLVVAGIFAISALVK